MTSFENLSSNQKIRAALHRDVRAICTETCHFLGLEISKSAMEIVAELVYKKLSVYGTDLEAFAKHAKRATINTEDVKLLVRRCPSLKTHLNTIAPTAPSSKEKKRKTIATPRQSEAPTPKPKESEKLKEKNIQTSKFKDTDIPTLKSKEPETSTSILASKLKEEQKNKEEKIDDLESMIIDDDNMIDLTFD